MVKAATAITIKASVQVARQRIEKNYKKHKDHKDPRLIMSLFKEQPFIHVSSLHYEFVPCFKIAIAARFRAVRLLSQCAPSTIAPHAPPLSHSATFFKLSVTS